MAAAVIGTGVAIGGAAADPPQLVIVSPDPPVVRSLDRPQHRLVPATAVFDTAVPEQPRHPEDAAGPVARRPEGDRYGDIGASPGETPARPPYAPARRGHEPALGARPTPSPAPKPGSPKTPLEEPAPPVPPPPPLPFPTPYPLPPPTPVPVPPVELPVPPLP